MMNFDEMGFCGDMHNFFSAPLGDGDVAARHTQPQATLDDDKSDEEIDVDELEWRIWRDKLRLKRLKEQNKGEEGVEAAKQRHLQEHARRKMSRAQDGILKYMLKMMEVCKAQGFVYGIIPGKGKPVTGASDNLREWWKDKVRFDRNGPAAITKYQEDNAITCKNDGKLGFSQLLSTTCLLILQERSTLMPASLCLLLEEVDLWPSMTAAKSILLMGSKMN